LIGTFKTGTPALGPMRRTPGPAAPVPGVRTGRRDRRSSIRLERSGKDSVGAATGHSDGMPFPKPLSLMSIKFEADLLACAPPDRRTAAQCIMGVL